MSNSLLKYINNRRLGPSIDDLDGSFSVPQGSDNTQITTIFSMNSSGKVVHLEPRTYTLTSLINATMQNTVIQGVPGLTKITGAFGYSIIRFKGLLNCTFNDIIFESTYTTAVEDMGSGVVFSYRNDVLNVNFNRCTFTAPNANTNGLSFYVRINSTDNAAILKNVTIDNCDFINCGRMGIITLNRSYGLSDAYDALQGFNVLNSRFTNLGLNGMYGMAISYDGVGKNGTFRNCTLSNLYDIGIENTGYSAVNVSDCTFNNFIAGRPWAPFSFSIGALARISDCSITNNRCLAPANNRSNFIGVDNSYFANNQYITLGDYAFHLRNSTNNIFYHDKYTSDVDKAVLIGTEGTITSENMWDFCIFDSSSYTGTSNTVTFDGSTTTNNTINRGNIKRTAGNYFTSTSNSIKNKLLKVQLDGISYEAYRIINLLDDNYALNEQWAQWENLRFGGTLTATRTIFMPRVDRKYLLVNTTSQSLNITCNNKTFVLSSNAKILVSWQSLSDDWYTWSTAL